MSAEHYLPLWVVYENPSDYPGKFVVREWRAGDPQTNYARVAPTVVCDSLEAARAAVPPKKVCIGRCEQDDPCIVEVWL